MLSQIRRDVKSQVTSEQMSKTWLNPKRRQGSGKIQRNVKCQIKSKEILVSQVKLEEVSNDKKNQKIG